MFTDRFIKVPIELFSKNAEHIGYNDDSKTNVVGIRINPLDISYYRENSCEGELTNETCVWFKNGEYYVIVMPIYEFESLLNHYGKWALTLVY